MTTLGDPEYLDWTRYWAPLGQPCNYDADGFVPGPRTDQFIQPNEHFRAFSEFDASPLLLLVGEPGVGKSREIELAADALRQRLVNERDDVLFVDMKQTSEESRLRELIFDSDEFVDWRAGDHVLHVFLDSLDEAYQSIRRVKSLILSGLDGAEVERLRLRIACRTAERIDGLEQELARTFQIDGPDVIELMPLTKSEILLAAEQRGLDRDAFIAAIVEKDLQPFANSPNFLFKLLHEFETHGEFPSSTVELFERFCVEACQEPNEEETDRPHVSAEALVDVAARIATAMTFSGRNSTVIGREPGQNECVLGDFLTAEERAGDPQVARTEAEALLDRTFQTSLFTGYTSHSVGFKSKTIAEFLTARHLVRSGLQIEDLARLTTAKFDGRVWVQPQMIEVAKWLAQMNAEYREFAVEKVPTALVGGDLQYLTDGERQTVLLALFESVEVQEVDLEHRSFRRSLGQLNNANAQALILEKLSDRALSDETRDTAIDAIRSMSIAELIPEVTSIALDDTESLRLRTAALYAIGDFGTDESRAAVAALGLEPPGGDADDEVKGSALRAAFPSAISAEDLFAHLTHPQREALIGAYSGFLFGNVVQNLEDEDLQHAMGWLELADENEDPLGSFGTLQQKLFIRLMELPVGHELWPRIAEYAANRIAEFHDLIERPTFRGDPYLSEEARRKLVTYLVPLIDDERISWSKISVATPTLVAYEDAEWIIDELEVSTGSGLESGWADLAWVATHFSANPEQFARACDLSDRFFERAHPMLAVEIGSDLAATLRENHEVAQTGGEDTPIEQPGPAEGSLSPEFIERFEELLARAESGDLDGFWQLSSFHDAASRRITDNRNESGRLIQLLDALPESFAERVCAVAASYLAEFDPKPQDWIGRPVMYWPSVAAYRAMRLLDARSESWLDTSLPILIRWVHTLVWWPYHSGEEADFHRRLAEKLLDESPDTLVNAFMEFVRAQSEHQQIAVVPMDGILGNQDMELFESPLLDLLSELEQSPEEWRTLLRFLLSSGSTGVAEVARDAVRNATGAEPTDPKRFRGIESAVMLVSCDPQANWATLSVAFHDDPELGKSIVERVSDEREDSVWTGLGSEELGASFEWMEGQFPLAEDPPIEASESPRHRIARLRNNALTTLSRLGTRESVGEVSRLQEVVPHLDFLPRVRHTAVVECLRAEHEAVSPQEAIELCRNRDLRAIASESGLQRVVLESLARYQAELETTGECLDFWNESPEVKPKPEGIISDKLKRWFERDLGNRGIIINREVIVQTLPHGQDGDRTDLKLEAANGDQSFSVIVEVKGCWNREIPGSLETQLVDQYLVPMGLAHGIYVVARFAEDGWVETDGRRNRKYSRMPIEEITTELTELAAEVAARREVQVDSVVLGIGTH